MDGVAPVPAWRLDEVEEPPRGQLRRGRDDRSSIWVILDGAREIGTGANALEPGKAEEALRNHLARNHRPPRGANRPTELLVSEIMSAYLSEHAPNKPSARNIADFAADILQWWGPRPCLT